MKSRCMVAALGAAIVLLFQFLTVRYNYNGNWTGLFCIGGRRPAPPELASEKLHVFPGSYGYDGQFYHLIAHDPAVRTEIHRSIDLPKYRYLRILLPALAWLVAAGRAGWIDAAYIAVFLSFIALGTYWMSTFACRWGRHPAWGLTFLALPATIISADRLVVDAALTAMAAGLLVYTTRAAPEAGAAEAFPVKLYLLLAAAPLIRETSLLLAGGCFLYSVHRKHWRHAALFATAPLPWLAWFAFLSTRLEHAHFPALKWPPLAALQALFHPIDYALQPWVERIVQTADLVALLGILLALALAARYSLRRPVNAPRLAAALFVLVALLLPDGFWDSVYDYGRYHSPLLVLALAEEWFARRRWWAALPVALMLPRLGIQLTPQFLGILRGLSGGLTG